jgi:hypothetical protein
MSTPAQSFDNLRAILGKLDRKIDNARSRRLGLDDEPQEPEENAQTPEQAPPAESRDQPQDDQPAKRRSPFGRAKPLNRPNATSQSPWIGGAGVG